jgi:hypothetical protein
MCRNRGKVFIPQLTWHDMLARAVRGASRELPKMAAAAILFFLFPSGVCVPEPVLSFYFRSGETLDVITADYYTHDVSIRYVCVCVSLA